MTSSSPSTRETIARLGPWFHNLHLPDGTQTFPQHPLGDFPARVWRTIGAHVPEDLRGWSVLDIGCNAGFYSFELARRGADVTAIDHDAHYLAQAQWAARQYGLTDIRFRQMQVYELAHEDRQYDLVWFMGVFYHLRYPLLGLDIVTRKVRRMMVFQTMTLPGDEVIEVPADFGLDERENMLQAGWPRMAFIENRLAGDPTNWWSANHACVGAMLRSCGMRVVERPMAEVYVCQPDETLATAGNGLLRAEYLAATGQSTG